MLDPGIFQIDGIHQVMQCDVGVTATQAGQQRCGQSAERRNWTMPERAEQQVEPDNVRLQSVHSFQQTYDTSRIVERPTALDMKPLWFFRLSW